MGFLAESLPLTNCHRLARQRDQALEQLRKLRKLQTERKERRARDLQEAAGLRNLHKKEKLPYDSTEYGFDFSTPEIDTYIHRETRKEQARWTLVKAAA